MGAKKTKTQYASPANASLEKLLRIGRDNFSTKGYWILVDGWTVTLCAQESGKSSTASIQIPRKDFNALVRWYLRPQVMRRKP